MKINKKIALAALGVVLSATALLGANENIRKAISMTLDDVEAQSVECRFEFVDCGEVTIFHCDDYAKVSCTSVNWYCTGHLRKIR